MIDTLSFGLRPCVRTSLQSAALNYSYIYNIDSKSLNECLIDACWGNMP